MVEYKPHFHEWATVQPGMVALARKKRTAVFRQYVAAETAVPVIGCAACLPVGDEKNYFFAGVVRSKSVRNPDDGIGKQLVHPIPTTFAILFHFPNRL
jgi:N-acetylglutamate synthase-like GNAT family acetyltransferase